LWILAQVGLVVAYKLDFHELFFPKQTEIELHGVEYKLYEEISPCSSDFASFEKCNYMAVEQCYRNSDNCRTIRCNDCVELFIENGKPMAHLENGSVIEVHRALD
jgi:hypothetical protein